MLQRGDAQGPVPLKFPPDGRAAGELLAAVDRHGAGSANRRPAGIPQGQTAVEFVLDPDQQIEHGGASPHVEAQFFIVRFGVLFGIESLKCDRETHQRPVISDG